MREELSAIAAGLCDMAPRLTLLTRTEEAANEIGGLGAQAGVVVEAHAVGDDLEGGLHGPQRWQLSGGGEYALHSSSRMRWRPITRGLGPRADERSVRAGT